MNLKKLKDNTLITNIKNYKCSESLKELVDRHGGMLFNIGKKYCVNCDLNLHDINDHKYWIVFNAVNSFDKNKGSKFSTWLGNQIRFFCLNHKNKNNKLIPTEDISLEYYMNEFSKKENTKNQKEIINTIIELFDQITDPNTKNAIYYRYFYNKERILNYSEIAEILKVTPQTVLNWHNKFIRFAKKKLTNQTINSNI